MYPKTVNLQQLIYYRFYIQLVCYGLKPVPGVQKLDHERVANLTSFGRTNSVITFNCNYDHLGVTNVQTRLIFFSPLKRCPKFISKRYYQECFKLIVPDRQRNCALQQPMLCPLPSQRTNLDQYERREQEIIKTSEHIYQHVITRNTH